MAGLAGDDFGGRDAFVFGLVRQHRARDDVADGVDAGDIGAEMLVDEHPAAIVFLHADRLETKPVGVWHTADSDQHDVGIERLRRAAGGRLDLDLENLAGGIDRRDFRGKLERNALLLLQPLKLPRDFAVDTRQDVIEKLDDRDLRAEPPPHRAELHADHAGADHDKLLRHLRKFERAGR